MSPVPQWFYSTCSFLAFVLVCIPLPWHLEAWNTGTCLYMVWTGIGCLMYFINSIIWADNVIDVAPLWCDITARYLTGMAVGIPCAALCIQRRLYLISTIRSVTTTKQEKRRAVLVDLAIGLGIPLLQMVLQVIVQGHRYNIYGEIGCMSTTYATPLAFVLVYTWPTLIGCVSAVYCGLTIHALAKRRSEYNTMLSGNKNLNSSRYMRLMGLAGIDVLLTVPLSAYLSIYLTVVLGVSPWLGWADTHYDFHVIQQYPAFEWRSIPNVYIAMELTRWSPILCAAVFFAFFGFAQEARKNYRMALNSVAKRVGYTSSGGMSSAGISSSFGSKQPMSFNGQATLPIFVNQKTTMKRDSYASFSTNLTIGDVGGTLDDIKASPYSPTDSMESGSSCSFGEKDSSVAQPPRALNPESPPHYELEHESARPDSQTINLA